MNRPNDIRLAGALVAITLTAGLTACAPSQSVADACAIYTPLADEFRGGAATADPAGAAAKLKDVQSKITNDRVKPMVDKLVTYMTDVANASPAASMAQMGDALTTVYTLDQLCSSGGN